MTAPVVISNYWAAEADKVDSMDQLKARLMALGPLPADVVLVSAGEVSVLLDEAAIEFYQWLGQHSSVTFISAACASFHGAILDFYHSDRQSTVVIGLEIGKMWQQSCLDSLGIGTHEDPAGLDVVPGVGFIALRRLTPAQPLLAHELVVESCQLMSQPAGMNGTNVMIKALYQLLSSLPQQVLPVSFAISSPWGHSLMRGLENCLHKGVDTLARADFWLPSVEQCSRHYLSLKPLFELQLYQDKLPQHSLLLLTLGGGGRLGVIQLGRGDIAGSGLPEASFESHCLAVDLAGYQHALSFQRDQRPDFHQQIRNTLKYPRSRYRGCSNHYFKWPLAGALVNNNRNIEC